MFTWIHTDGSPGDSHNQCKHEKKISWFTTTTSTMVEMCSSRPCPIVHSKTIAKLSCATYTMRTNDRLIIINCEYRSGVGCNIVKRHCERLSSDLTTSLRTEPTIFHLERSEKVFQASLLFLLLSCCQRIDLCFDLCHYIYFFHSI